MGPHEVKSCTICEWELDPKKVMGTGGVACDLCKTLSARPSLRVRASPTNSERSGAHVAACLLLKAPKAQHSLCPIKSPLSLTHSPLPVCFYFALFIFIPSQPPSPSFLLSIPQCISSRLLGRCFWKCRTIILSRRGEKKEEYWLTNLAVKRKSLEVVLRCWIINSSYGVFLKHKRDKRRNALYWSSRKIRANSTWQSSWLRVVSSGTAISCLLNAVCERGGNISACGPRPIHKQTLGTVYANTHTRQSQSS